MDGDTRLEGKIPRAVVRWHRYGYRAEPGYLIVDVAQRDPAAALITNRTRSERCAGRTLSVTFTGRPTPVAVLLIRKGTGSPLTSAVFSKLHRARPLGKGKGKTYQIQVDQSLLLVFGHGASGVLEYHALVEGTDIEVSGGSGPGIIIEP